MRLSEVQRLIVRCRDTPTLPEYGPVPAHRKWRTSYQVPFAAMMTWEKFTCTSSYVTYRTFTTVAPSHASLAFM